MKILWVKAGKLLPVDTGGKIRSFNLLRHLARQHRVVLLSYYGGNRDKEYESAVEQELPGARVIHTGAPEGMITQSLDYLLRLPSPIPYAVRKFTDDAVRRELEQLLADRSLDVAVCDFLASSLNFPMNSATPVVLFQHNVESILWLRMAKTEKSPVRKLSYKIEAKKMAAYEEMTLRRFRHVIAVSDTDRNEMLKLAPDCSITVVPTGVDTEKYKLVESVPEEPPIVVFTGSMDWEPNMDAMEFFCQHIWPPILTEFPRARFRIVGRSPHSRVRRLASESVEVTGSVPSVIDYLRSATVVVVPLRIGGGTRLKIYEAMAMGKALVSTSIGAEGLDFTDRRDLYIADDAKSFAAAVLNLLRDPGLRRRCEVNAAALAASYDWSQIAHRFTQVLNEAVAMQQTDAISGL